MHEINIKKLKNRKEKEIWHCKFYTTTDDEDNDTEDEIKNNRINKIE